MQEVDSGSKNIIPAKGFAVVGLRERKEEKGEEGLLTIIFEKRQSLFKEIYFTLAGFSYCLNNTI